MAGWHTKLQHLPAKTLWCPRRSSVQRILNVNVVSGGPKKKNGVLGWWREAIFQQCCCDAFTEPLAPAFRPDVFDVSKSRTSNIHLKKTALGIVPRVIEKNLVKCKTCYQCLKFSNIYPLLSSFSQKKHGVAQLSTTIQPLSPELWEQGTFEPRPQTQGAQETQDPMIQHA